MSESTLNEFLDDIQGYIENTPDLSILIKKRFNDCSKSYIHSSKFEDILNITRAKIDSDNSRVFVHLRDFLNELKSNKAEKKVNKKRKRRESGCDNTSEAPSPKSLRDNSTDQDTDGSVVENNEAFHHQQQPNRVNELSLNHITSKSQTAVTKIVDSNIDLSRLVENGYCESSSQEGSIEESDQEGVKNQESNVERGRNQESLGITSVRDQTSTISDGDEGLCMTVEDECHDLDPSNNIENLEKSKGNSYVNGGIVSDPVLSNDCITIDDDDDEEEEEDGDDKVVLKEPSKEMKTEDFCELDKENDVIDCPKSLKREHSDNEDDKGGKISCTLKEQEKDNLAVVESKAEICDEHEKKSVNETSESEHQDLAEDKNPVETKQIENQQTDSSSKFVEARHEDDKDTAAHTFINEGTLSTSMLPLANESSEPIKKGSQRQIRRLENLLENIRNKIEELKNADLSLDALEDEDSVYIQEDRYQQKFVKVWKKLCELKGAESTTGRPIERRFFYKGTRYPEVNRKLEKFVNKHKIFPDFHDVQKVIRDTSKQKKLGLNGPTVDRLAREAFQDIGELLQKRRISDLRKTSLGHLQDEQGLRQDPALRDPELKKKLDENRKVAKGKLDEVLEKFCKWQEETPEDESADKKSEEEEEDKEEMEMFVKEDVPEMIAILNDSDEESSTSPVKATTDGSSSSVTFLPNNVSPCTPASVQRCKDMMAISPFPSPCSSQVSRKPSSSSLCSDSSPNPESPYVANSPPDLPAGSDISDHPQQKKPGTLVSIEDYMDHMPVLPKEQITSNMTNDKSLSDKCPLKISDIRSIAESNCSGEDGELTSVNSHKEGAKSHLKWPTENSTSGCTKHIKHEPSPLSDSNISDGCGDELNSSNISKPSSVQRSIMFRNSRKNVSLKLLNRGPTVINLADEDESLSKPMPLEKDQHTEPSSPEEVIIVLSDSD